MNEFPDPLAAAQTAALQQATQLMSLAFAAGQEYKQVAARWKANKEARRLAERRATEAARRGRWAPAFDPDWMSRADLLQVARVWSGTVPYAPTDPLAAEAMLRCEQRLRGLHPHGMMHYDRLRHEGFPPASAMWYAAPFFSRDPHIRVGDPGPVRAALPPADPNAVQWTATAHDLTDAEVRRWLAEQQGRQIINRLQDGAEATNREPWSPTELTAELEKRTNLEPDVIATIVAEDAHTRGVNLEAARANYETALADTAARDRATNLGDAFDNPATTHVNEQPHRMSASERETLKQDAARARASSAAAMVTEEYPHTPQHAVAHTTKYGSKGRAPASQTTPEQTRRSRPGSGPTT